MESIILLYLSLSIIGVCSTIGNSIVVPRMSPFPEAEITERGQSRVDNNIETYYYEQRIDHFNYFPRSYDTFKQRYMINAKYWGGANSNSPIFVYLGAEDSIDDVPSYIGVMTDNAPHFKALLLYIEHRYYGESIPLLSNEEPFWNANNLGSFTSAQAIVDYAMIIQHIKESYNAPMSPVVVIGASYGGMLATWFRLKFPHVAIGALASSAPILLFDGITPPDAFYDVVTKDFKDTSETCYQVIANSWAEINRVASLPNGLSILSQKFNTCDPLTDSSKLVDYLESMYAFAAQYDLPPSYPVTRICNGINKATFGNDTLSRIYGGVEAFSRSGSCRVYDLKSSLKSFQPLEKLGKSDAWEWQQCTELVFPIGIGNHSMFPPEPYNLDDEMLRCELKYGVSPLPHWVPKFYGGMNISLALRTFASNIIFSNGLRDPFSSGGVLNNLSESLVAIHTAKGAHCLDIYPATGRDPKWLSHQRRKEVKIIHGWLSEYYDRCNVTNKSGTMRLSYPLYFVVLFLGHFGPNFFF